MESDNNNKRKEGDNMTALLLEKRQTEYIEKMQAYVEKLKKMPSTEAKKIAKESLVRSGIINTKGDLTSPYKSEK